MKVTTDWYTIITNDIKNKYGIKNPVFSFDETILNVSEAGDWFAEADQSHYIWVRYKRISDDTFELKEFYPDPPDEVCKQIIESFFDGLRVKVDNTLFIVDYLDPEYLSYMKGTTFYTYSEAKKELFYLLRNNVTKISLAQKKITEKDMVCHLVVVQDTIENMVEAGLLVLEYDEKECSSKL